MGIKRTFNHEVFLCIFCAALLVCGIWSALNNRIQLLPDVEPPKITFSIVWPGASKEFLTSDIVYSYERAILGRLQFFKNLNVLVNDEEARFEVEFEYGVDLDGAEKELKALLTSVRSLPLNVPQIEFQQGGRNISNRVVGSYFIVSESGEFNDQQQKLIRDIATYQLKLLKGVERVELNPQLESQLSIKINMDKLSHLGLSYEKVRTVVLNLLDQPVTRLYEGDRVITAQYKAIDSLELIGKVPVDFVNGVSILLEDVASIEVGAITKNAVARYNGEIAISMRVLRDSSANLIEVQKLVEAVLDSNMSRIDASGLTFNLSFDTSIFIERAILWVLGSLAIGFLLSSLVSFIFFKRFLPTVLGGVITILSVCGVFFVLYISDISINVITLAGITFATGMFVDGVLIFMLIFLMMSFFLIVSIFLKSKKLSLYVLMTLPTTIFGGLLGYNLLSLVTRTDFNVLSILGFMIMLGVVANNSILLVDTIRNHFTTCQNISSSMELGGNDRYRAIFISSITTIAGMLPLLLLPSDASVIYQGIAAIIVGGMVMNLITVQAIVFAMVRMFGLPDTELASSLPSDCIDRQRLKVHS